VIDVIHIGDYKTGTTWLQMYPFQQHPELLYIDRPDKYPEIANLFYELVDVCDLDFDPVSLHDRFEVEINRVNKDGKKLIVSREAFFGDFITGEHARRVAERLYQVFGTVKIMMVVREQFSMLASIYSQYVKIGGTLTLREFIWDPFISKSLIKRLQYERNVDAYVQVFGIENVLVGLFEEFKNSKASFLRSCFSFMGCKDVSFQPFLTASTNLGLTSVGAFIQRWLNRFARTHVNPSANVVPFDKLIALFLTRGMKEFLLCKNMIHFPKIYLHNNEKAYLLYAINMAMNSVFSLMCERIRLGKKIQIPEDVRLSLVSNFKDGNQVLVQKYDLDLKKYGWTL